MSERADMHRQALEQFDRAEARLVEVLAQVHPHGESVWEMAKWEEMLDHVASLHARMKIIRARLGRLGTEEG